MGWRNLLLIGAALLLAGCSHDAGQPAGWANPATEAEFVPGVGAGSLPGLSQLPTPIRSASLAGPGFIALDPLAPLSSDGTTVSGSELVIDGNAASLGSPAYALYGLQGFKPGVGPTSVRLTLNGVTGEYYAAFADYASGLWVFAGPFTDSVTAEIPGAGTPNPADFLSPNGYAYFAVICARQNLARLAGVELGLQGGTDAPAPVTFARYTGMAAPYTLIWHRSPDYADLDFAGYIVERAPLTMGSFTRLTPSPIKDHYFLDNTVTAGAKYRVRIATVDVSGNQSAWFNTSGPDNVASDPVCILKAPSGPINAPQSVVFDLSASFDPLGQPITEYHILLGGGAADYSSPDPIINMTVQPGCYIVGASILTAESRYGDDEQPLKAYPTWQSDPVVVRQNFDANGPCWTHLRLYRDPASGLLSVCALDSTYPGVSLWRQNGGGGFDQAILPDYGWQDQQQPIVTDAGQQFVLMQNGPMLGLAQQTGAGAGSYTALAHHGAGDLVLAAFRGADGAPWVIKLGDSMGSFPGKFVAAPVSNTADEHLVADCWQLAFIVRLAQNPATGIVHILGSSEDFAATFHPFYAEFDPVSLTTTTHEDLDESYSAFLDTADVEVVPATGDFWEAYHDGMHVYTRTRASGTWQPPVVVDGGDPNFTGFDLAIGASAPCILISVGRPLLYAWSGSAWVLRNTVSYTADDARVASIVSIPDTDEFFAASVAFTGELYLGALHPDGSNALIKRWVPSSGAGLNLSTAPDDIGVHVLARSNADNTTYHYYSHDDCASFSTLGALPNHDWIDLTATATGQVHLATWGDTIATFQYWDGSAFIVQATLNQCELPMLSQVPEDNARFAVQTTDPTDHTEVEYGNPTDGYIPSSQSTALSPTYAGVIGPQVLFPRLLCIGNYDSSVGMYTSVSLVTIPGAVETKLYTPQLTVYLGIPEANARCSSFMAASYCLGHMDEQTSQVYWSGCGEGDAPQRVMVHADGSFTCTPLPGSWNADPLSGMPLRSVQAAETFGHTAVCVAAGLFGTPVRLEWSNYGDWEELPLPPSMAGMGKYELCVDLLGNWHLFAHDWVNDRIMCISTVDPAV